MLKKTVTKAALATAATTFLDKMLSDPEEKKKAKKAAIATSSAMFLKKHGKKAAAATGVTLLSGLAWRIYRAR
ncbi:hypothetical protein [Salinithrix halophila]|uniref:Uncharacterized protein n=1 Tax=Salinithrix halophila TaxID=1485204 RepID=A0ABV8JEB2_9BACL